MSTIFAECPACSGFFRIALPPGVTTGYARFNPIKADCPHCGRAMAATDNLPDGFPGGRNARAPTVQGSLPAAPRGPAPVLIHGGSGTHSSQPGREISFGEPMAHPQGSSGSVHPYTIHSSGGGRSASSVGSKSPAWPARQRRFTPPTDARSIARMYTQRMPARRAIAAIVLKFHSAGATADQRAEAITALRSLGRMADDAGLAALEAKYTAEYHGRRAAMDETCPMCLQPANMGASFVRSGVNLTQFDCPTCGYQWVAREIRDSADHSEGNASGRGNSDPPGRATGPRQILIGERRSSGWSQKATEAAVDFLAHVPAEWIAAPLLAKAAAVGLHADETEELAAAFYQAREILPQLEREHEAATVGEVLAAGAW